MPKNPLARLAQSPQKSTRKQLQEYIGIYAGIVDNLRTGGADGRPYTDAARALNMQELVNVAEKIKSLDYSEEDFNKRVKGLSGKEEALLRSNYREYVGIKNGNMSPQQVFKSIGITLPVPEPILGDATLLKKLEQAITKYDAAEGSLKIGQQTTGYTDAKRKEDLQKLVDGAELVKRLHSWIPRDEFDRVIAALPDWQTQQAYKIRLADMEKIVSGEKSPSKLANQIGIKLPIPTHQVPITPPSSMPNNVEAQAGQPEAPKKDGFFSRFKNKVSDLASSVTNFVKEAITRTPSFGAAEDAPETPKKGGFFSKLKNGVSSLASNFANYMKAHPVRGGLLIAGAVAGVAIIVAASVFTGGAAGAAAVGGMAALMGTGAGSLISGVLVGGAVTVSSAIALAYDVNAEVKAKELPARLRGVKKVMDAPPNPSPEQVAQMDEQKGTLPKPGGRTCEDRLHKVNNEKNKENMATTAESREHVQSERNLTAPSIDGLVDERDDIKRESPHLS